jgi:hypothetical protein
LLRDERLGIIKEAKEGKETKHHGR